MQIDLCVKSQQLLESLANSIHDRAHGQQQPFFFSINEIHITEKFLENLLKESIDESTRA